MSQAVTAHLGLGSNLGDRRLQLEEALRRLHRREGIQLTRLSSLYETAPVGFLDQPLFSICVRKSGRHYPRRSSSEPCCKWNRNCTGCAGSDGVRAPSMWICSCTATGSSGKSG